jgi:hypothetical protein
VRKLIPIRTGVDQCAIVIPSARALPSDWPYPGKATPSTYLAASLPFKIRLLSAMFWIKARTEIVAAENFKTTKFAT